MTNTTNFIDFNTPVVAAWLNDIDARVYDDVQNVRNYGAVGNGVTDDTAAINAAITALSTNGGEVYFPPGNYLISSTLTITTNGVTLRGSNPLGYWNGVTTIYQGGSVIVKKSTMTTEAIQGNDSLNLTIKDIAIVGQVGNGGDGIYIPSGQRTSLINVSVARCGGTGIRIGPKVGAALTNANGWQLHNVTSMFNGANGLYLHDAVNSSAPNCNGGTAAGLILKGNTGSGLLIESSMFNDITGLWAESNTSFGVSLVGFAAQGIYTNISVSDVENNTAGNWNIGANLKHVNVVGPAVNFPNLDPNINFSSSINGGGARFRSIQFNTSDSALGTYKEAAWVPTDTSGAGLSFTLTNCRYVVVGKIVVATGRITWPVTANGAQAQFSLPPSLPANTAAFSVVSSYTSSIYGYANGTNAQFFTTAQGAITNANMSGKEANVTITYTLV